MAFVIAPSISYTAEMRSADVIGMRHERASNWGLDSGSKRTCWRLIHVTKEIEGRPFFFPEKPPFISYAEGALALALSSAVLPGLPPLP
jgi:hypothetical protein